MAGNRAASGSAAEAAEQSRGDTPGVDQHPPLGQEEPPAKRSKKSKRKVALTSAELDSVRIVPVPKRSAALAERPAEMQLSRKESAPQIRLSEDKLTATFHKGYRMVRATHGAHQGTWYFEVTLKHLGETGHCRLGWCTNKGELQGPVGYDEHSFGYRDLEGVKVHKALRRQYGEPFREGDVVGCLLHMLEGGRPFEKDKSEVVTWKGALFFVDGQAPEPHSLPGSLIAFTRNGASQGVAFRDLMEGTYYPAVSMYTLPQQSEGASATVNFGPTFQYDPPAIEGCPAARPACEMPTVTPAQGLLETDAEQTGAVADEPTAALPAAADGPADHAAPAQVQAAAA